MLMYFSALSRQISCQHRKQCRTNSNGNVFTQQAPTLLNFKICEDLSPALKYVACFSLISQEIIIRLS